MAFGGSPHQSSLPLVTFFRIHIGASIQKNADNVDIPRAGSRHQDRLAVLSCQRLWICARIQQRLNHCRASSADSLGKRSCSISVNCLRIRTGSKQQVDGFGIVPMRRPMQGGGSVRLGGIHVGALFQQRLQRTRVSSPNGISNLRSGRSACDDCAKQQER